MGAIGIAWLLGLFFGPALLAGLVAWGVGRARAGVVLALAALAGLMAWGSTASSYEMSGFAVGVLAAFMFTPAFALAVAAAFAGAAWRRRPSATG